MKHIKFIHTAGTNGKGTTCNHIARGLIHAGKKTGLFTSPHVLCVTERITVNNQPIPAERIPDLPHEGFFQALWAIALEYFAECEVEYAVIETGIGGLLDCTNKINPILSVITKIGYDHMDLLGNTIEEIAHHKAGIIKPGVPVVTDPTQFPAAMRVISETARAKGSQLLVPKETHDNIFEQNRIVAREALKFLGVTGEFDSPVPLARFQTVCESPKIIVDGAHNYDAIKAVLKLLPEDKTIVFGMLKTKDYNSCIKLLDGFGPVLVEDVSCPQQVQAALDTARKPGKTILVLGSLYLAANVLRLV
jgi:dihydrofolate synthase/folylpolyglutamate synthase